jgi:hypothetical protein
MIGRLAFHLSGIERLLLDHPSARQSMDATDMP